MDTYSLDHFVLMCYRKSALIDPPYGRMGKEKISTPIFSNLNQNLAHVDF